MRRKGFTLIELLVVIAIIAILAAMLFPVFARARESARKIQCLSNVKNIAMAIQMYLTDYDRFPPYLSQDAYNRVEDLLRTSWIGGHPDAPCIERATQANPYLRWPVILDEYVKNREVWNCPSARYMEGFDIAYDPGGPDGWAHWMADHPFTGWDGQYLQHPCETNFPVGWGGSVTDSAVQFTEVSYLGIAYESVEGQFGGSIGVTETNNSGLKTAQINDPVKFLVCGDSQVPQMGNPCRVAWDVCCEWSGGCADWVNCSFSQQCGIDSAHLKQFWTDSTYRSRYTRHLGGGNYGFADGHAAWWNANAFLAEVPHQDCPCEGRPYHPGTIEGADCYANVVACPDW